MVKFRNEIQNLLSGALNIGVETFMHLEPCICTVYAHIGKYIKK